MTNAELDVAEKVKPTIVVIFGGCGDLTNRKLMPALYNLYLAGLLPERSVSYTHLDVYKRQMMTSVPTMDSSMANLRVIRVLRCIRSPNP